MTEPLTIHAEPTPNPHSMKFTLNRTVAQSNSQSYRDVNDAANSPLAQTLFTVQGVKTLFLLNNFITVGRHEGEDWAAIVPGVEQAIRDVYQHA